MFFRNRRLNNVAGHNDSTLEFQLCILRMSSACGQQLRNRATTLQDDYPLSGSLHVIEDRQASGFEVGCVDGLHVTSIGDQADRVKPNEATADSHQLDIHAAPDYRCRSLQAPQRSVILRVEQTVQLRPAGLE